MKKKIPSKPIVSKLAFRRIRRWRFPKCNWNEYFLSSAHLEVNSYLTVFPSNTFHILFFFNLKYNFILILNEKEWEWQWQTRFHHWILWWDCSSLIIWNSGRKQLRSKTAKYAGPKKWRYCLNCHIHSEAHSSPSASQRLSTCSAQLYNKSGKHAAPLTSQDSCL